MSGLCITITPTQQTRCTNRRIKMAGLFDIGGKFKPRVSFKRQKNKYEAHIRVSGKYKFIGLFSTAQEASKARNAALQ